ncbi:MAG: single-stranded-DNA-specific exonuclease RecJ [Candidatus Cloacimonetes bacterium]|nr:single-stranded-DNA-specific exonuclease RecJ [Candidatus Cloacimonadota bacterium]
MHKRWQVSESLSVEKEHLKNIIVNEINCPELIAELLIRKNLVEIEEIEKFFNPDINLTYPPETFTDMPKAVERIIRAIDNKEKITVYGDYDVDGTTSTALLYLGLKRINAEIDFYVPHRMVDGYGLSLTGLQALKDNGTKLIISVDCGINAVEEVDYLINIGMDIIITDHHNPKEQIPAAYAIINPKVATSNYPFENLAGVGVAYKLLMAVYKEMNILDAENEDRFLDLVAVGTIADIVSLTDENRTFASLGLKRLAQKKNKGLTALINIAGLSNKALSTTDIVFGLAPRINAAGRMGSATRAVELLISEDPEKSAELAAIIEEENQLRQHIDQLTFQEACEIIEKKYSSIKDTPFIVVTSENWHPGVIGIVASKLVEKYYRPTIMISFQEGTGIGSGRSISDFDLFEAISQAEDLLESFGGHKYAAGLTILTEYLPEFERRLSEYATQHISEEQLIPPLRIDDKMELYNIDSTLMKWLDRFAPFGPDNMRPVFCSSKVMVVSYPYVVGKNHLKLRVMKDGVVLNLIGFNMGEYVPLLRKGSHIDIAYTLENNSWQGKTTIQGKLKDIRLN